MSATCRLRAKTCNLISNDAQRQNEFGVVSTFHAPTKVFANMFIDNFTCENTAHLGT